jgi:hypothetical protein
LLRDPDVSPSLSNWKVNVKIEPCFGLDFKLILP